MRKDTVLGTYDSNQHVITININSLKNSSPQKAVEIIAHECYHAYQRCLTHLLADTNEQYKNLLLFTDIRQYVMEYSDYHDGGETHEEYEEYYSQSVEEDAREYAESAVERYDYIQAEQQQSAQVFHQRLPVPIIKEAHETLRKD